jgi:ABC-type bacteriocin/lantibiotic exporter with double-glycine peptidase domain
MFPTYIKTGSMGDDHLGMFMSYSAYRDINGIDYFKTKVRDFFTATHLEPIFFDTLSCAVIIAILHAAWIIFVIVGSIIALIYGIVQFVVHLRDRHVRKEEFHSALRGD